MENVQRRQRRMNETSMAESGEVKYFCMGKAENSFQMIYSQFLGGRKQLMNAPGMSKNSSSTRRKNIKHCKMGERWKKIALPITGQKKKKNVQNVSGN